MKQLLALVRRNWLFFLAATIAALALRLFFVYRFPHVAGDSLIYGDIAKHWLTGIYGLSDGALVRPTLIRLPGYPGFLAAVFAVFGREHYTAVMIVQAIIDTNVCLVCAALALELMNERAAKATYLLAALCPFTANYAAAPLTETLAIACAAHALYYGVRGIKALREPQAQLWPGIAGPWLAAGLWTAAGILIRPDGVLVLGALGLGILALMLTPGKTRQTILAGAVLVLASLAPLAPWAIRNWHTFRVFQPLAPRYANDPGEFVPHGFNHWIKTWMVEYVSVEDIYWPVSGQSVDFELIPERAFDSRQEYDRTEDLVVEYNQERNLDADLDAQFEQLAAERINHNPFRYYVWLPTLRIADMWLRPRTELLPVETRWWEFSQHRGESIFALLWAGLNLFYLAAAFRGWLNWRLGAAGVILVGFILLRSAFLGSLENPEPRYVLECFPALLALAGGAFARRNVSGSTTRKPA